MAFYNSRAHLVPEMLSALLSTAEIDRLGTSDGTAVLVRRGHDPQAGVAVISGGGSGHEPAHAGFLGDGMLAAAVPGSLFASPPVSAVLEAIRAVTGPAGCVLIIKNYTGDRLNFGLAAERAREEGLDVRTVLVADDVSLPEIEQPRGLAGTVLVHKVAGHLAAAGASVEQVAEAAQRIADGLRTIGLALTPATLPGEDTEPTRGAELGLGIHNEPGAREVDVDGAAGAVQQVLDALDADEFVRTSEHGVVAVLNDLGGCSPQEGLVLTHELLDRLGRDAVTRLLGPARLMTSLDMHGFSVTLAPASEELVAALDAPTTAPGWVRPSSPCAPQKVPGVGVATGEVAAVVAEATPRTQDGRLEDAVAAACRALESAQRELDELDRAAGDADAGTTFAAGAQAVRGLVESGDLGFADPAAAMRRIARTLETAMGGSSGVLLAILATAAGRSLETDGRADWSGALAEGIAAVQHHGGAAEGDRTMLDALIPAQRALAEGDGVVVPAAVAQAAAAGAEATATLTARAGRAAYVPDSATQGSPDAGAAAVAKLVRALADSLS